jgi:hypothetical protein
MEFVGWHEVALGAISLLLTVSGALLTVTVRTVLTLHKDFGQHVIHDATQFGEVKTLIAETHTALLQELAPKRKRRG